MNKNKSILLEDHIERQPYNSAMSKCVFVCVCERERRRVSPALVLFVPTSEEVENISGKGGKWMRGGGVKDKICGKESLCFFFSA